MKLPGGEALEHDVAVSIKLENMNAMGLLAAVQVDATLLEWLKSTEFGVNLTATALKFTSPTDNSHVVGQVPVTPTTLQKISNKSISTVERLSLKKAIEQVLMSLQSGDFAPKTAVPGMGALDMLPPTIPVAPPVVSPKGVGFWPMYDLDKMQHGAKVQLADATKMYQPVNASSAGSRYFVIGGNDALRVAARYKGSKLSIRIEGPQFKKYAENIGAVGLALNGDYASVHVEVSDDTIAAKVMGAILLGLGVPLTSPMPDIKAIKGKGV